MTKDNGIPLSPRPSTSGFQSSKIMKHRKRSGDLNEEILHLSSLESLTNDGNDVIVISPTSHRSNESPSVEVSPHPLSSVTGEAPCPYCNKINTILCEPIEGFIEEDVINYKELKRAPDFETPKMNLDKFQVFDTNMHLCAFDDKLEDPNCSLYFSGFVKPYDSETLDKDGYPCSKMGPIEMWWFEEGKIGISTEFAHYYLLYPVSEYEPFFNNVVQKVFLAGIVVDVLRESNVELSYNSLLSILANIDPPNGTPSITEEMLLKNGSFVCYQVQLADSEADSNAKIISISPAIEELGRKINYDFTVEVDIDSGDTDAEDDYDSDDDLIIKRSRKRRSQLPKIVRVGGKKLKLTMVTTTALVQKIFVDYLKSHIDDYPDDKSNSVISNPNSKDINVSTAPTNSAISLEDVMEIDNTDVQTQMNTDVEIQLDTDVESQMDTDLEVQLNTDVETQLKPDGKTQLKFDSVELKTLSEDIVRKYLEKYQETVPIPPIFAEKILTICLPKVQNFIDVELNVLDEDIVEFHLHKYDKPSKRRKYLKLSDGKSELENKINEDPEIYVGDFVSMFNSNSIARVISKKKKFFHAHWYIRSMDTILAETGHPNEIFESSRCEDISLRNVCRKVSVRFVPTGSDWFQTENGEYIGCLGKNEDPSLSLYYQKRYCEKTARFEDVNLDSLDLSADRCYNCERNEKLDRKDIPYSEEEPTFDRSKNLFALETIRWRDENYQVGTCVFLDPGTIMKLEAVRRESNNLDEKDYDEELYPEKYRKKLHTRYDEVVTDPFDIGYITRIWCKRRSIKSASDILLDVKKFYRPPNTSLPKKIARKFDLNLLFWSDEDCSVNFSSVQGKCYVSYEENLKYPVEEWSKKGPYRFYFCQSYLKKLDVFTPPPPFARKIGNLEQIDDENMVEIPPEYPPIARLRSLDVFSGCGGLTCGLDQAKVAEVRWAIDMDTPSSRAFKLNYPNATVFDEDANVLLKAIMQNEVTWNDRLLPRKGDVELLCGGPPCQGFSGLNRFSKGRWSKFNNTLIATFLAYCDHFRPRFFIMENVRTFVPHEKSTVLKLTLNCLVRMGYQVAFSILQSGRFGIPQSRPRVIIIASAPGEKLPMHPECSHTFAHPSCDPIVDDIRYSTAFWKTSAPYRMITVFDSIWDLPEIEEGDFQLHERPYIRKPITHFQRESRTSDNGQEETVLRDHIYKTFHPIVTKRLSFIPKNSNCDWRDLPNIVVRLSDGTLTKKLKYTHKPRSSKGALRGVCRCSHKGICHPKYKQKNTIIPWCLTHTASRNAAWEGSYGRLQWDEFFKTIDTTPSLMGTQGRVGHPEENRIISVREYARSQGFPDRFQFFGTINDKYRQVGNAVAPPLAKAIGLEIRKSVFESESRNAQSI